MSEQFSGFLIKLVILKVSEFAALVLLVALFSYLLPQEFGHSIQMLPALYFGAILAGFFFGVLAYPLVSSIALIFLNRFVVQSRFGLALGNAVAAAGYGGLLMSMTGYAGFIMVGCLSTALIAFVLAFWILHPNLTRQS